METVCSGSVLCIWDLVSSIAAGPGHHHLSGFWQETTFWGRVSEMGGGGEGRGGGGGGATPESGITFRRSTTPTLSHSETGEKPYKHKKRRRFQRVVCFFVVCLFVFLSSFEEEVLDASLFEKLRCNLRRKK